MNFFFMAITLRPDYQDDGHSRQVPLYRAGVRDAGVGKP
jgi:hypothetical protein